MACLHGRQPLAVGLASRRSPADRTKSGRLELLIVAVEQEPEPGTASTRECAPHLGQTFWLPSRSFFQMIWRQPSHFSHRPSVRMWRSPCSGSGNRFFALEPGHEGKASQKAKVKRQKSKVWRARDSAESLFSPQFFRVGVDITLSTFDF